MIKLGIKKIEYRADNNGTWKELKIVSLSANLSENWKDDDAGKVSTVTVDADIRNSSKDIDIILEYLSQWYWEYKITDMNDREYLLGNTEYRADFTFTRTIGGLKVNGYSIKIEYISPQGIAASN
jgi:hypothetical protein